MFWFCPLLETWRKRHSQDSSVYVRSLLNRVWPILGGFCRLGCARFLTHSAYHKAMRSTCVHVELSFFLCFVYSHHFTNRTYRSLILRFYDELVDVFLLKMYFAFFTFIAITSVYVADCGTYFAVRSWRSAFGVTNVPNAKTKRNSNRKNIYL